MPIMTMIIIVNFFVDPGGKFSKRNFYQKVSTALAQGKNILITERMHNFLGSDLVVNLISNQEKASNLAIIGSSRIMTISGSMVGDSDFMNYSAHGIRLGDYIGIYELLYQNQLLPKKLIIDLSSLILMDIPTPKKGVFFEAYNKFLSRVFKGEQNHNIKKSFLISLQEDFNHYSELLSPKYFQESIHFIQAKEKDQKQSQPELTFVDNNSSYSENIIQYDNSRYKGINASISENNKIYEAESSINKSLFTKSKDIDQNSSALFIKFFQDIIAQNIDVVFLVVPFDPYFYDELIKVNGKIMLYIKQITI
jgi:hypothetical protein